MEGGLNMTHKLTDRKTDISKTENNCARFVGGVLFNTVTWLPDNDQHICFVVNSGSHSTSVFLLYTVKKSFILTFLPNIEHESVRINHTYSSIPLCGFSDSKWRYRKSSLLGCYIPIRHICFYILMDLFFFKFIFSSSPNYFDIYFYFYVRIYIFMKVKYFC